VGPQAERKAVHAVVKQRCQLSDDGVIQSATAGY
jgi:hypothetical protein